MSARMRTILISTGLSGGDLGPAPVVQASVSEWILSPQESCGRSNEGPYRIIKLRMERDLLHALMIALECSGGDWNLGNRQIAGCGNLLWWRATEALSCEGEMSM